jgi:CheY-like chemotaxis protein
METKKTDGPINILLVDDQEINNFIHTKLLRKALLGLNFEIFVDLNGEQAINHLYHFINHDPPAFPDYIFLDINMPVMNGWQFLDEYTKLQLGMVKNSKVFVTSSSLFKDDIDKSFTYPCVKEYITKPLTLERLQTIMYA